MQQAGIPSQVVPLDIDHIDPSIHLTSCHICSQKRLYESTNVLYKDTTWRRNSEEEKNVL